MKKEITEGNTLSNMKTITDKTKAPPPSPKEIENLVESAFTLTVKTAKKAGLTEEELLALLHALTRGGKTMTKLYPSEVLNKVLDIMNKGEKEGKPEL